ncbi:transmembrane protein 42 [Phlebotomus argentipes]|uniref:transmembrane protein 42 n=1 Tax=Phlebotomus argentipes TaxID=94469 RepID=UPI002892B7E0|nr:transmembrane protein 42 [Phlebotomus argentipes]
MFAILAGLCAAGASVFGKLSSTVETQVRVTMCSEYMNTLTINLQVFLGWTVVACCLILMIVLNALVWTFFVKALHAGGGSVVATSVSSGTNYFASALLGWMIFGESTTLLWWFGTSLILTGIILISLPARDKQD